MIRRILFAVAALALSMGALVAGHLGISKTAAAPQHSSKTITIGNIGWDEDVAVNSLLKVVLTDKLGYTVNLKLADAGPLYQGVASGSLDVFMDTWLPKTQALYWAKYKAKVVKMAPWYTGAANLGLTVPNYSMVHSISQLNAHSSQFGGKIVGIEPGAGEMNVVQTKVISGYGLHYTLQGSSTPAMLSALQRAMKRHQQIVVTLWKPHWAFTAYPIRYLKDPKGLMGGTEKLSAVVRKGLQKDQPQAYKFLSHFRLSEQQLGTLEIQIRKSSSPEAGARTWLKTHKSVEMHWMMG
ncbi:MAG: glycine betaine ABC transporter substrate-binding protein [Chloroflexota bacterium]|nr:MAG: glycine/betaine ABC transporter substrate-binding protein [Chloroflexota bacterium]